MKESLEDKNNIGLIGRKDGGSRNTKPFQTAQRKDDQRWS
jgi:hypothetical protein